LYFNLIAVHCSPEKSTINEQELLLHAQLGSYEPSEGISLISFKLPEPIGGSSLSKTPTSGTRTTDQAYSQLNLDASRIEAAEFVECRFSDCSFVETIFKRCRFVSCQFTNCDFSLCKIPESVFISPSFEDSKLIGINWAQADWDRVEMGVPVKFNKCALNHSTFIGIKLVGLKMLDSQAINVDFREADLSQVDFSGSDLSDSLFQNTNLSEADFRRAINYGFDPGANQLQKAKFSLPEAMSLLYHMDIILVGEEDES
jgi:fluoroquinolone resistance protein